MLAARRKSAGEKESRFLMLERVQAQKQKSSRVLVSAFRGVGDHRSSIAGTIFYELQSCLVEGEHPNVHQMRIHTHH